MYTPTLKRECHDNQWSFFQPFCVGKNNGCHQERSRKFMGKPRTAEWWPRSACGQAGRSNFFKLSLQLGGQVSPWANSKIPTFHFFPRGGRFDFINWFILPRITGNRLLGGEKGVECCVLDESLKHLSLPWQHKLSSLCNAFLAVQ